MKPFDLVAAKAGKPIQLRDGTPATYIGHSDNLGKWSVIVEVNGRVFRRLTNGANFEDGLGAENDDLVMAPTIKKKKGYLLRFTASGEVFLHGGKFSLEAWPGYEKIKEFEIEYEDDD